jgi:hypothetical protein
LFNIIVAPAVVAAVDVAYIAAVGEDVVVDVPAAVAVVVVVVVSTFYEESSIVRMVSGWVCERNAIASVNGDQLSNFQFFFFFIIWGQSYKTFGRLFRRLAQSS